MKKFVFVLPAFLCLTMLFGVYSLIAAESEAFRVMSFNILCDESEGVTGWGHRRETVIDEIRAHDPLLLGVQEATPGEMDYLSEKLPEYASIGVARDDGARRGEFSALFYKKESLELLDSGTFWLSEHPERPGVKGWDAACCRIVTWGKFKCKKSGREFACANTHFDHIGQTARRESAKLLLAKAAELTKGELPFFVSGDFNADDTTDVYKILTGGYDNFSGLTDAGKIAPERIAPVKRTYHEFGLYPPDKDGVIDYVFINEKVAVQKYEIGADKRNGRYPSDHNSLTVTLKFK